MNDVKKPFLQKVQVWVHDSSGKVLLLKTNPVRGAFWQPVTGSVESGETLEVAAAREAAEETGVIGLPPPRALGFQFQFRTERGGRTGMAEETCFEIALAGVGESTPIRLDPREHTDCEWVTVEVAQSRLKFESNRMALEILARALVKRGRWSGTKSSPS
ncbi:MAG: NUDIX domain-containing protein [Bacteriovoracia bacterium]